MAEYYKRRLVRHQAPSTEVLSLAEAKLYLRVDASNDDALISSIIVSAREAAEQYVRNSLVEQQWKLIYDSATPARVILPMQPVNSIVSVETVTSDGTRTLVDSNLYCLREASGELQFSTSLVAHKIEVIYSAGSTDIADIPEAVKQGIYVHISALYDGRSGVGIPDVSQSLYQAFRSVGL